ncbi:hypothetical protein B0H10DRAFT_1954735 [Mycena sp. CBHHK59/15]|nr:hypothetical protein B0H10DRAFT_1954735 [Mycena sp. CBHHK59/15]
MCVTQTYDIWLAREVLGYMPIVLHDDGNLRGSGAPPPQYELAADPVDLSSSPVPPRLRPLTPIESQEADFNVFPASLFPGPPQQMAFPVNDTDSPPHLAWESTLGMFSATAEPKPLATHHRRKPAVKVAPVDEDSADDDLKEFEIVLHVFPQAKKRTGRNGKGRTAKPEPVKLGPFQPMCIWDSIIVKMDAPVKKPATQHMSWSEPYAGPSSVLRSVDDYESGDDGPKKKAIPSLSQCTGMSPFRRGLEEVMEKLTAWKIMWAAAIQRKATSLIKAPMASNLFTAKKAIKKAAGPAAAGGSTPPAAGSSAPPMIPSTPASHPTQPQFPFWQNPYAHPPPMPGHPGFPPMPYPPLFPNYQSFDRHSQHPD